ncbi:ribonuclease T2-like protein [Ochromonadaceae sp. CCMP2298]|nr:ribonuclease T2-like protein [Ochromonadaceae sp. CCMP2298]
MNALVIFALLACCARAALMPTKALAAANGTIDFDLYVLAYTWTPEFCYGNEAYPGCAAPQSFWTNHFTMHGLWPQYTAGGYPADCTTEAYDEKSAYAVGFDTMTNYWPEVEYSETDPEYTSFWNHEWTKHGTCTGLAQTAYFQNTIDLITRVGTPASVVTAASAASPATPGSVDAASLRTEMGGAAYVSLQCEGGNYLSGAYTCWAQTGGIPTNQQPCPSDVISEDTCTSSSIIVTTL